MKHQSCSVKEKFASVNYTPGPFFQNLSALHSFPWRNVEKDLKICVQPVSGREEMPPELACLLKKAILKAEEYIMDMLNRDRGLNGICQWERYCFAA